MIKKYYTAILIVILMLTCIIFNIMLSKRYYSEQVGRPGSDPQLYNNMALSILNGKNYFMTGANGNVKADIGREVTPFYSAMVAISYFIGGLSLKSPYILNVIFNCLTIILLFFTIKLITKKKFISFLFCFIFIFYYPLWRMNFSIMMEVSTVFFFSLTIYLFTSYYYSTKINYLYFSVFFFSILCLINNRFIVLLFAFFIFQAFITFLNKESFKKLLIVPALISILTISPWFIRQYIVYKQFIFFTPLWTNVISEEIGFFKKVDIPTAADDKGINKPLEYEEYLKSLQEYNSADIQQSRIKAFTFDKYKEIISRHNSRENKYVSRLKKYFNLFEKEFKFNGPNDYRLVPPSTKYYKIIQIFILLPLFILAFAGIIFSIRKKNMVINLLTILLFSHILLHVVVHFIDRYRLTVLPVLLIIAAYGFAEICSYLRDTAFIKKIIGKFKLEF